MPVIPADTRRALWKAPHGMGSFEPIGKKIYVEDAQPNMSSKWKSHKDINAARIFVGFNVGGEPRWKIDDLIAIVTGARKVKGRVPDASYVAQKGVYTSKISGEEVTEEGAQLIIIDMHELSLDAWEEEMMDLAETICRTLKQEEVVLEIQVNGLIKNVQGVGP